MKATENPPKAISRETAEHYVWGNSCDGWHLVKNANLSVIEECMPAGTSEVRHYHQRAQQFFFILSGQAAMETEGVTIQLSAGEGVHILPGKRHQIRNDSSEPVRFLVISQPPSHGDRVVEWLQIVRRRTVNSVMGIAGLSEWSHSGAQGFDARLRATPDEIQLSVRDQGIGFDAAAPMISRGLGLISMREQVSFVKGTMLIASRPMGGTEITVRVPLIEKAAIQTASGAA